MSSGAVSSASVAVVSTHPRPEVAAGEVLGESLERVGQTASFVLVAAAGAHRGQLGELLGAVDDLLAPETVVGVTTSRLQAGADRWRGGQGDGPGTGAGGGAFGVFAVASLPVGVHHLRFPDGAGVLGVPSLDDHDLVVIGDAGSASLDAVAAEVAAGAPDAGVVGGLLSAEPMAGAELWLGDRRLGDRRLGGGALGLTVPRARLDAAGVQGLRRLGATRSVTEVDGAIVVSLDGEPAIDVLRRDLAALERPPRSAESLMLAVDHALDGLLDGGSALAGSPILGLAPERRGLAVGGDPLLRPGARVCFAEDAPARVGLDLARRVPVGDVALAFGDGDGLDALPSVADRFDAVLGLGAPIVLGPVDGRTSGTGRPRSANGSARLAVAALLSR